MEEVGDDLAGVGAGVFGFRGEDEAVGDDIGGEGLDDFRGDEFAALEEGDDLGGFHEGEGGSGAGGELDFRDATGCGDEGDGVVAEFIGEADAAGGGGDVEDVLAGEHGLHGFEWVGFGLVGEDFCFLFGADVAELALHGEAIHLSFREWECAAEFDGVLSGDGEEETVEVIACAVDGDLAFAHGLEKGALSAGGGAVDFVRKEDVCEDGAFVEAEFLGAGVEDGDAQDVGGEEIGGELDAFEFGVGDGVCDGFGEGGFAGSGEVFEEDVAAGEHAGEDFADGGFLAVYDLADGVFQFESQFGFFCHVWKNVRDCGRGFNVHVLGNEYYHAAGGYG